MNADFYRMLIGFGDRNGFLAPSIQNNMLIYINIVHSKRRFISMARLVNRVWCICKNDCEYGRAELLQTFGPPIRCRPLWCLL